MWNEQVLTKKQVVVFFTVVSLIYVYPIIRADYAYVDDNWRALLWAGSAWRDQGRILLEILHKFLTFTGGTTNIFPLPLFIAVFAMALAMTRLTFWYFSRPDIFACLVVLPVLCNPFFLGNISYQYDGPGMMLAVVAIIYAVTCEQKSVFLRGLLAAILIAISLALYQLTITLFVGLCCVECLWNVRNNVEVRKILVLLIQRGLQLLGGGVIYFLTANQLNISHRGNTVPFDSQWASIVRGKFLFAMDSICLLVNSWSVMLIAVMLVVAGAGFLYWLKNIASLQGSGYGKLTVLVICISTIPILLLCVPGVMLFLVETNLDARNYIGFSALLVLLLLLGYDLLGVLWVKLRLLLVMPILLMFSFCYAYGQILIAKKELESAVAQYIAYDIVANKKLSAAPIFYYVGPRTGGNWLPRGHAAMTYMPSLRYVLSGSNALLHPQFMTRLGINNVVEGDHVAFDAAVYSPVVDRKFYSIYLTEQAGFIVFKEILDPEDYTLQLKEK
ncbi:MULTISPECIES: glucosyltransferase domain-containing protein [unclassified Pseudomonas]|uniref:glucosyltransferase domain-containing protein n=1 Tax=unclassified Pseudomonas TaxID=196821 RepID=UPI0014757B97|nr:MULTISPECIES: glucosyltransferase domain-containing protein [unclassified Pseudomonas]NMX91454.1 hypothetical protein [Pseudomonas sp. WS 5086]NMY46278.1 hypothetical protein [Pseudomonas sp. WS 5027]